MPAGGPPLAGGAAPSPTPPACRRQSPACPGRKSAPSARQVRSSGRCGPGTYAGAWSRGRKFFSPRYVIDRAATSTPQARSATPHATADRLAGRPFAMSRTGSASGSPAAPWMGGRSAPSSIKPHAGAVPWDQAPSPRRHRRDHLPSDRPSHRAPVVNYRVALLRAGLLEPVVSLQEPQHARDTHPRSRATAAPPRDRLVLGRPPLRARARRASVPRRRAVVLRPLCRGRQARPVVLWRRHLGRHGADEPAGLDGGPRRIARS
jgi:hypothetical protein